MKFSTLLYLVLCVGALAATPATAQTFRTITVRLHLGVPEGTELPDKYTPTLGETKSEFTEGRVQRHYPGVRIPGTNDFVFTGDVHVNQPRVTLLIRKYAQDAVPLTAPAPFDASAIREAWVEMRGRLAGPAFVYVPLQPAVSEYELKVELFPAVQIVAKLVDSAGERVLTFFERSDGFDYAECVGTLDGQMVMEGVRRGQSLWISYMAGTAGSHNKVIYLTSEQLSADLDLGSIVVDKVPTTASADISVTNVPSLPDRLGCVDTLLTCVAVGAASYETLSIYDGKTRDREVLLPGYFIPKIVPQEYYLVPGSATDAPWVQKVMRLTRAGCDAELIAAGIPRATAVADKTLVMTLDVADVIAKVERIQE